MHYPNVSKTGCSLQQVTEQIMEPNCAGILEIKPVRFEVLTEK
jgi:hypothetical protein